MSTTSLANQQAQSNPRKSSKKIEKSVDTYNQSDDSYTYSNLLGKRNCHNFAKDSITNSVGNSEMDELDNVEKREKR